MRRIYQFADTKHCTTTLFGTVSLKFTNSLILLLCFGQLMQTVGLQMSINSLLSLLLGLGFYFARI